MQKNKNSFLFKVSDRVGMRSANFQTNKLESQSNYRSFASFIEVDKIEEVR